MRRAAKADSNQSAIVDALRRIGVKVYVMGKPVDLLCYRHGYRVVEVKNPEGRNRLTKAQVEFLDEGWPVDIVRSVDEALQLFKEPPCTKPTAT